MHEIKNYMEDAVKSNLDRILTDMNICKCEACKLDIMAITLNNLPPKYVVTKKGELYTKIGALQSQFEVDIISAVAQAVEKVKKNPRHSTTDDDTI